MDDQTLWFEWTQDRPIIPHEIFLAVKEGGMGLTSLRLLGAFEFTDGAARMHGERTPPLAYTGPARADGRWDLEISGYAKRDGALEVINVRPWARPKTYQP